MSPLEPTADKRSHFGECVGTAQGGRWSYREMSLELKDGNVNTFLAS